MVEPMMTFILNIQLNEITLHLEEKMKEKKY